MRPDTIVRLYSMTKCIVSVALGICLEALTLSALGNCIDNGIPDAARRGWCNWMIRCTSSDLQSWHFFLDIFRTQCATCVQRFVPEFAEVQVKSEDGAELLSR